MSLKFGNFTLNNKRLNCAFSRIIRRFNKTIIKIFPHIIPIVFYIIYSIINCTIWVYRARGTHEKYELNILKILSFRKDIWVLRWNIIFLICNNHRKQPFDWVFLGVQSQVQLNHIQLLVDLFCNLSYR